MDLKEIVPSELNPPLSIQYITSDEQLPQLDQFLNELTEVGCDTETNFVDDFYIRRLRTIQLGNRHAQYVVDLLPWVERARFGTSLTIEEAFMKFMGEYQYHPVFEKLVAVLKKHLENSALIKIGHSLQFEYEIFKWCFNIRMQGLFCTLIAEKILRSGSVPFFQKNYWGLDDLVGRYLGLKLIKDEQKGFTLGGALTANQMTYGALDVRVPLGVRAKQLREIIANRLTRAVQLECDAIPAFGDMFLNGIILDVQAWMALVGNVKERHQRNVAELDKYFIPIVGEKKLTQRDVDALELQWRSISSKKLKDPIEEENRKSSRALALAAFRAAKRDTKAEGEDYETYEGKAAINYGSSKQLLPALWAMGFSKKELKSTDDRVLGNLAGTKPVIKALQDYRETAKLLTTYGEKFAADTRLWYTTRKIKGVEKRTLNREGSVHPQTRRVHSRILQIGAETGRTSSKDPNLQNLPKMKEWRACFVAAPGHKILTIDMNGCELRILTEYSGEPQWVDAFNKDWDVHSVGAEIIFKLQWKAGAVKNGMHDGKPVLDKKGNPLPDCAYYYQDHKKCDCPVHKKLRDQIKAINFGIAYGMSKFKLADTLKISVDDAAVLLEQYQQAFPTLLAYLMTSGADARNDLLSRTLSGRWRKYSDPKSPHLKDAIFERIMERRKKLGFNLHADVTEKEIQRERMIMYGSIDREGKNTPIQGSNADIMKVAMGCGYGKDGLPFMWQRLEPDFKAKLVNFVHDEFVVEVPDEHAQECYDFVSACMSRAGAEFVHKIPMTTDGVIGNHWSKS